MSSMDLIIRLKENGFLMKLGDREFDIDFVQYPQFRNATVEQIVDCYIKGEQAIWPALDVDIDLHSLSSPDNFPLVWW